MGGAKGGGGAKGWGPKHRKSVGARRVWAEGGPQGWGPEGWGPKGERRVGPRKGGARTQKKGRGQEGWGPEEWGAKISRFFSFSRLHVHSFLLSLGIFSCLFFSLRVSSRVFFPLSGGLLVEFWWCFGRSGPQMCLFSPSGCRVEAPGGLQAEQRSINPRQEATDNATPCIWTALRAQQRLLRVGQSGHEHTVPVVFLNPGCCFVLPPMSHSTRLSVLRIVGRWAESVCKRFP